MNSQGSPPQAK